MAESLRHSHTLSLVMLLLQARHCEIAPHLKSLIYTFTHERLLMVRATAFGGLSGLVSIVSKEC